jgi:hypothetical protein
MKLNNDDEKLKVTVITEVELSDDELSIVDVKLKE